MGDMEIALEMTQRQSRRVIEQAVRGRVSVVIEPRVGTQGATIHGTVDGREGNLLSVRIEQASESDPPSVLIGTFSEVRLAVAGQHYLFTTCVLDVSDATTPIYVLLAVPNTIQVANRRRFERYSVPTAAQVRMRRAGAQGPEFVALLADVSADGMSCSLSAPKEDDALLVGEPLDVVFELPGYDEHFDLPGTVCNRALTPDKQLLTLGLEFTGSASDPTQRRSIERLQAAMYEIMNTTTTGR